jgi:hypothetical protein
MQPKQIFDTSRPVLPNFAYSMKRLRDELDDPQAAFHDLARDGQSRRAANEESMLHAHNDP